MEESMMKTSSAPIYDFDLPVEQTRNKSIEDQGDEISLLSLSLAGSESADAESKDLGEVTAPGTGGQLPAAAFLDAGRPILQPGTGAGVVEVKGHDVTVDAISERLSRGQTPAEQGFKRPVAQVKDQGCQTIATGEIVMLDTIM